MRNSPDSRREAGAARLADITIVVFILSTYLLETSATSTYFQGAQILLVVAASAVVLQRGRVTSFLFLPWLAALIGVASLAALFNPVGITLEYRTFLVNGVLGLAFVQLLPDDRQIILALRSFGIAGLLASLSLLSMFDTGAAAATSVTDAWALRLGSTLPGSNPNIAAMYLAIAFGAALGQALAPSVRSLYRLAWLASSLVILVAIAATGSRKAIIYCVVVSLVLVAYSNYRLLPVLAGVAAIGTWAIVNVEWLYVIIGNRFLQQGGAAESDAVRAQLLSESSDAFQKSPLGMGWGSSRQFLSGLEYTHINYLEVLVSLGLLGAAIYYAGHVRIILGSRHMNSTVGPAISALTIAGLGLDLFQVTYLYKAPMLIFALGAAALHVVREGGGSIPPGRDKAVPKAHPPTHGRQSRIDDPPSNRRPVDSGV